MAVRTTDTATGLSDERAGDGAIGRRIATLARGAHGERGFGTGVSSGHRVRIGTRPFRFDQRLARVPGISAIRAAEHLDVQGSGLLARLAAVDGVFRRGGAPGRRRPSSVDGDGRPGRGVFSAFSSWRVRFSRSGRRRTWFQSWQNRGRIATIHGEGDGLGSAARQGRGSPEIRIINLSGRPRYPCCRVAVQLGRCIRRHIHA